MPGAFEANAREEIAQWQTYDYVLINADLQRTFGELRRYPRYLERAAAPSAHPRLDRFVEKPALGKDLISSVLRPARWQKQIFQENRPRRASSDALPIGAILAGQSADDGIGMDPLQPLAQHACERWPNAACVTLLQHGEIAGRRERKDPVRGVKIAPSWR